MRRQRSAPSRSEQDRAKASAEKAQSDFERKKSLISGRIITEADWLATEAAYRETKADLARAAVMVDRAIAQAASAAANVKVLQARLDYATIRSPLNGVVVMRDRNVGDLLSPGTSLMQIVDPATIIISARFDESVMDTIEPGQTTIISPRARIGTSKDAFCGLSVRSIRKRASSRSTSRSTSFPIIGRSASESMW
jgi:HlyD family secretion protein